VCQRVRFTPESGHRQRKNLIDEDLQTGNVDMREMSKSEAREFQSIVEAA
jgi:hypothetical protein